MNSLLEGIHVIDLSGRLPGPYASYCLSLQGAEVIKLENTDWGEDPFNEELINKISPNFQAWYKNLNQNKKIEQISFSEGNIIDHILKADIIIAPASKKLMKLIQEYQKKNSMAAYIHSSKTRGGMHDLNALGLTKTFSLHLQDSEHPPYLPFAGMAFGQFIAQGCLAGWIKSFRENVSQQETFYLDEITLSLFDVLHSEGNRFLHNGLLPCYQIYPTKDEHFVCLAAVEEHYWQEFIQVFELPLKAEDSMDSSGKTAEIIRKLFTNLTSSEIKDKIRDRRFCLTLTEK